jgi:hypothetical protein
MCAAEVGKVDPAGAQPGLVESDHELGKRESDQAAPVFGFAGLVDPDL